MSYAEMTPDELEQIRLRWGVSVTGMARVLGLDKVTIHGMKNGKQKIRLFNAMAIRWLDALTVENIDNELIPEELRRSLISRNDARYPHAISHANAV